MAGKVMQSVNQATPGGQRPPTPYGSPGAGTSGGLASGGRFGSPGLGTSGGLTTGGRPGFSLIGTPGAGTSGGLVTGNQLPGAQIGFPQQQIPPQLQQYFQQLPGWAGYMQWLQMMRGRMGR